MTLRDIQLRARALFRRKRVDQELNEELAFHMERETRSLIERGVDPVVARQRAQTRFGSTTLAADQCRDERGTAFIDNTISDVQYAFRSFRKARLAAITIVVTVAIGLGLVAVLFTVLNSVLFRVDQVPDVNAMYSVERPLLQTGEPVRWTRATFEAMRTETSVFTDAFAEITDIRLRVDGRVMTVNLVSGNFNEVVGVSPVIGRALTRADDDRAGGHPVILLSDTGWTRHFTRDPHVVGRSVLVAGAPFDIIGVMPPGFRGLEVGAPDCWAPLSQLAQLVTDQRGREDSRGVQIIGRVKTGVSVPNARAQLAAWDSHQSTTAADRRAASL